MEETPICASVERDLQLSVDDLVTSTDPAGPEPAAPAAATASSAAGPE